MTHLSVNLNKIALLRNSRESDNPSVLRFAKLAIDAGANGITVHPRPDQRHIRVEDVLTLGEWCSGQQDIEFNIEGNPFAAPQDSGTTAYPGLLQLIESTRPEQATLVPDSDAQLTSDHGFDLTKDSDRLIPIIEQLHEWNVRVSLFMDPDIEQIRLAKKIGADRIELYTGPYAADFAKSPAHKRASLEQYQRACNEAVNIGLMVNAGHDLNLDNLSEFLNIGDIAEVSIGHALTVDALLMGYKQTILNYSQICHST